MSLFYLVTLYCVIRGATGTRAAAWYTGAIVACWLGMGSKEVMITAPVVVLLYDWMFLARGEWREIWRKRRLLYAGLTAGWAVLALLMTLKLGAREATFYAWQGMTPASYAATQLGVICRYLKLAVWPSDLCLDYAWQPSIGIWEILLPGIFLGSVATITAIMVWHRSACGFLGAWFFVIIAPTSSVIPRPDVIVEHRMYLPLASVTVLGVLALFYLQGRVGWLGTLRGKWRKALVAAALIAILAALVTATRRRNDMYRSSERMWQDVVTKRPQNHRARLNLICALLDGGKFSDAISVSRDLLKELPDFSGLDSKSVPVRVNTPEQADIYKLARYYAHAHNHLGVALAQTGLTRAAVSHFTEATRLLPAFDAARRNLVLATSAQGNHDGADLQQ